MWCIAGRTAITACSNRIRKNNQKESGGRGRHLPAAAVLRREAVAFTRGHRRFCVGKERIEDGKTAVLCPLPVRHRGNTRR